MKRTASTDKLSPEHIGKIVRITLEKDGEAVEAVGVLRQYQQGSDGFDVIFDGSTSAALDVTAGMTELNFMVEVFE